MQGRATRAVARCIAGESGGRPVMSRISSRSFWDFGNTAVVMNLGTKGEGEASSRRNILIPQSSEAFMAVRMMCFSLDQHFLVQAFLAAEVVVHGGAVRSRPFADFLAGGFGEAPFGKDLACCLKDNGPR